MSELPKLSMKASDRVTQGIIGLVGLAAFTFVGYTVLPYVIAAVENTIYLAAMAFGAFVVVAWLWSNWTNLIYGWESMSRNIARFITRQNPINIMDAAIKRFEGKLEMIGENLAKADGARKRLAGSIQQAHAEMLDQERLYDAAKKAGKSEMMLNQYSLASERRKKSADAMQPMLEKLQTVISSLNDARDLCRVKLEDMKDRRVVYARDYETMKAGMNAVNAFKSFFSNNPDLEMLQLSIDEVEKQTAEDEASIDQFLRDIQPGLDENKLRQEADAAAARLRIESKNSPKQLESTSVPTLTLPEKVLVGRK